MRRPIGGVPRRPIGQFAGNAPDPNNPTAAIVAQLQDSLTGDPGIRLAGSRGRRQFRGGGLVVQQFPLMAGGSPASDEVLITLPVKAGTRSRALGQFRGLPSMGSQPWQPPTPGSGS